MRRGLSFVEVTVAFSILVLAVIPILTLFGNTAQQTRQTGDYALAMMLQERVAEDMRIASWENPHAAEDPSLVGDGTPQPVVDGKSPFFRGLEDTAEPYGQIDDEKDLTIDKSMPALYRQLSSYRFGAQAARRKLPTAGEVMDVGLEMQWRDGHDTARALKLDTVVPILSPRIAVPLLVRDRSAADGYIHGILYPDRAPGETLDGAIAATAADPQTVRDLGDVLLIMGSLAATREDFDGHKKQLSDMIGLTSTNIDRFRAKVALGRFLEARTAAYIQSVTYLGDRVGVLSGARESKLGNPPPDAAIYADELVMAAWLPTRMAEAITDTATAYTDAYNDEAALQLPRIRARVFMKILELCKIQALTAGLSDPAHLEAILASYNVAEEGKNINFQKYGEAEQKLCASLDNLRRAFASPKLIDGVVTITDKGPRAVQNLVPQPAGPGGGLTGGQTPASGWSAPASGNRPGTTTSPTPGGGSRAKQPAPTGTGGTPTTTSTGTTPFTTPGVDPNATPSSF